MAGIGEEETGGRIKARESEPEYQSPDPGSGIKNPGSLGGATRGGGYS